MSYAELYAACQDATVPLSRKYLIPRVCELTRQSQPRIFRATLDPRDTRGFILLPGVSEHPLAKFCNGAPLIVVARGLNYCWERFVVVKELMHYFDTPLERVSSQEEFEALLQDFTVPAPEMSDALHSEVKAFWMALGILCPELLRQKFARDRDSGAIDDLQIAEALKIPAQYVPRLFDPKFKAFMGGLLA